MFCFLGIAVKMSRVLLLAVIIVHNTKYFKLHRPQQYWHEHW